MKFDNDGNWYCQYYQIGDGIEDSCGLVQSGLVDVFVGDVDVLS